SLHHPPPQPSPSRGEGAISPCLADATMTDAILSPTATALAASQYRADKARRARRAGLLKHIFLILTSLIMIYPLIWMLSASFKPDNQIFGSLSLWPATFDLGNYGQGWNALSVSFTRFF